MNERRFVEAVRAALRTSRIDLGKPIVAAVSGGADSMAMLESLRELAESGHFELVAAHFNHGLRGADSDGDERFVVDWCSARDIRCVTGHATQPHTVRDASRPARKPRAARGAGAESPEAAARTARYAFLARVQADVGASAVATGHTRDDQAETVLLHLVRGSGLAGLLGMQPVTELKHLSITIVRPLLNMRRADTEAFCQDRGIAPRYDVTNEDPSVPRNRIRHLVVPQLKLINPAAPDTITRFASAARDDLDLVESLVDDAWAAIRSSGTRSGRPQDCAAVVWRSRFLKLHPALARRVLMRIYSLATGGRPGSDQELGHAHLDAMLALAGGRPGTSLDLPQGCRLEVGYRTIAIKPAGESALDRECPFPAHPRPTSLEVPGEADLGDGFVIHAERLSTYRPGRFSPWTAFLDIAVVGRAGGPGRTRLVVRTRERGDRFNPSGMAGEKKLQDFFVDEKVPRQWRDRVPLVTTERGVAWVVGYRVAEWARAKKPGGAVRLAANPTPDHPRRRSRPEASTRITTDS